MIELIKMHQEKENKLKKWAVNCLRQDQEELNQIELKDFCKKKLTEIFGEAGISLYSHLTCIGFFTSRGSTRFHGNYQGGLIDHCMNLYTHLLKFQTSRINMCENDIFVIALLHDICKVGAYNQDGTWNTGHPSGHAQLSLAIIEKFVVLSEFQKKAIKYHMGVYGTYEANLNGEYSLVEYLESCNRDPRIKYVHWCDDYVAQFIDFKK
jgi:hypothetical protein